MSDLSASNSASDSSLSDIVAKVADSMNSDSSSNSFDSSAAALSDASSSSAADSANSSSGDSGFLSFFRSSKHKSSAKHHNNGSISAAVTEMPANGSSSAPEWDAKDTSVSDRAGRISIAHIIGFFILFVIVSMFTVWLVNWFMRKRQQKADATGADEEMVGFVPRDGEKPDTAASTTKVEVPSNIGSATSRGSEGNSSRQQFLQSRREAAQRSYGATDENDTSEL